MNLRLRPDVTTTDTEHGTVLLDERSGRYWELNPTGTRILHALLADQPPERVAAHLPARHGLVLAAGRAAGPPPRRPPRPVLRAGQSRCHGHHRPAPGDEPGGGAMTVPVALE